MTRSHRSVVILDEQHDEWQTGRWSMNAESLAKLAVSGEEGGQPLLVAR